jgi:hypothetical protein
LHKVLRGAPRPGTPTDLVFADDRRGGAAAGHALHDIEHEIALAGQRDYPKPEAEDQNALSLAVPWQGKGVLYPKLAHNFA